MSWRDHVRGLWRGLRADIVFWGAFTGLLLQMTADWWVGHVGNIVATTTALDLSGVVQVPDWVWFALVAFTALMFAVWLPRRDLPDP